MDLKFLKQHLSQYDIPKYIEWLYVNNDKDINSTDIVVYTDQTLCLAHKHNVSKKLSIILDNIVAPNYTYINTRKYNEFK